MPFFATMPITMIRPMNDARLKVVPVTSSAKNTPDGRQQRRGKNGQRRREGAELEQQHNEDQHDGQNQYQQQIVERLLLLLVGPAVLARESTADRCRSATAFCTSAIPLPRSQPFQPSRHRDVALQVLAPDFGLSGQFRQRSPATQRRGLSGRAGQQRVAHRIQRGAGGGSGKRTRMV